MVNINFKIAVSAISIKIRESRSPVEQNNVDEQTKIVAGKEIGRFRRQ